VFVYVKPGGAHCAPGLSGHGGLGRTTRTTTHARTAPPRPQFTAIMLLAEEPMVPSASQQGGSAAGPGALPTARAEQLRAAMPASKFQPKLGSHPQHGLRAARACGRSASCVAARTARPTPAGPKSVARVDPRTHAGRALAPGWPAHGWACVPTLHPSLAHLAPAPCRHQERRGHRLAHVVRAAAPPADPGAQMRGCEGVQGTVGCGGGWWQP